MSHNRLRRAIEQERLTSYPEPYHKIAALSALLDRALVALGGPVNDERPQAVTVTSIPVNTNETAFIGVIPSSLLEIDEAVIIGNDPGDESEYVAGLGHDPK